jgi:hypothetical protein
MQRKLDRQKAKLYSSLSSIQKERKIGKEMTSLTIPSPPTHIIPVNKKKNSILKSKIYMKLIAKKKKEKDKQLILPSGNFLRSTVEERTFA